MMHKSIFTSEVEKCIPLQTHFNCTMVIPTAVATLGLLIGETRPNPQGQRRGLSSDWCSSGIARVKSNEKMAQVETNLKALFLENHIPWKAYEEGGIESCYPCMFKDLIKIDVIYLMQHDEYHNSENGNLFSLLSIMCQLPPY